MLTYTQSERFTKLGKTKRSLLNGAWLPYYLESLDSRYIFEINLHFPFSMCQFLLMDTSRSDWFGCRLEVFYLRLPFSHRRFRSSYRRHWWSISVLPRGLTRSLWVYRVIETFLYPVISSCWCELVVWSCCLRCASVSNPCLACIRCFTSYTLGP